VKEDWLEEGILVPAQKNKRGRIIEEGSSSAQEGGAQQIYVPPFGGIPTPLSYYGGPTMQAWGSGLSMPPQNYVVPNVTFAEPYTQYRQPQQSVVIIGGYAARNMQNAAAIQSNAAQLGEGVQTYYEQGYNYQDHQYQPASGRLRRRRSFSFNSFSLFYNFQLLFAYVCVVFSVFIQISASVLVYFQLVCWFVFIMNKDTTLFLSLVKL
jgi:hypothetical protein